MAITNFPRFAIPPIPLAVGTAPSVSSVATLDATGEIAGQLTQAPKAGDIAAVWWRAGNVTTGGTVDGRLETVSGTTGDPTGTLVGADSNGATVIAAANVMYRTALTTAPTVTLGQPLFWNIVRDAVAGNFGISAFSDDGIRHFPYAAQNTSGAFIKAQWGLIVGFEYTDGSFAPAPGNWPLETITSNLFGSGNNPKEYALHFTPTAPIRVCGYWTIADMDGDCNMDLLDTDGTSVLLNDLIDTNIRQATNAGLFERLFTSRVNLSAGSAYRLSHRPGATQIQMYDFSVPDMDAGAPVNASMMDAYPGGQAWHLSTKSSADVWSQFVLRRPFCGLLVDGVDDGAGGAGGSMMRPVAMRGGLV